VNNRFAAHMIAVLKRVRHPGAMSALYSEWHLAGEPPAATAVLPVMLLLDRIGFVCGGCGDAFYGDPRLIHSRGTNVWCFCRECGQTENAEKRRNTR
jgi:hypothetical protein